MRWQWRPRLLTKRPTSSRRSRSRCCSIPTGTSPRRWSSGARAGPPTFSICGVVAVAGSAPHPPAPGPVHRTPLQPAGSRHPRLLGKARLGLPGEGARRLPAAGRSAGATGTDRVKPHGPQASSTSSWSHHSNASSVVDPRPYRVGNESSAITQKYSPLPLSVIIPKPSPSGNG